jgi:hypothetical protein
MVVVTMLVAMVVVTMVVTGSTTGRIREAEGEVAICNLTVVGRDEVAAAKEQIRGSLLWARFFFVLAFGRFSRYVVVGLIRFVGLVGFDGFEHCGCDWIRLQLLILNACHLRLGVMNDERSPPRYIDCNTIVTPL